jgi:hypothetical protein
VTSEARRERRIMGILDRSTFDRLRLIFEAFEYVHADE